MTTTVIIKGSREEFGYDVDRRECTGNYFDGNIFQGRRMILELLETYIPQSCNENTTEVCLLLNDTGKTSKPVR